MRRTTPLVLCLLLGFCVNAQRMAVKKVEVAGEKIIVHYDLEDSNPNNEYQISLYSSQNNFASALAKVTGDVGGEIKAGNGKKIVWNAREELGAFKGKLSLEVRGKVFIPVAKFSNISVGKKFKRGKSHTIEWKAGNSNAIHIELMNEGQRIAGELNQPNNGKFSLYIPPHTSIGKGYTIRIVDSKNSEDVATSVPFRITRKMPLLVKVAPIIGAGVVILFLSKPPVEDEIPVPVLPTK